MCILVSAFKNTDQINHACWITSAQNSYKEQVADTKIIIRVPNKGAHQHGHCQNGFLGAGRLGKGRRCMTVFNTIR